MIQMDFVLWNAHNKIHLDHVSRVIQHGIHDIFPPDNNNDKDTTSYKKLKKGDGAWAIRKDVLGWTIYGKLKTIELELERVRMLRNS